MAAKKQTKVVGYIRVSTDKQVEEGVSLEAQEAKIRSYCEMYDLDLVGIEVDAGASGKDLARPGVQRALKMVKCGQVEGLIITKQDRLSRSIVDIATLMDSHFKEAVFISIAEQIDTHSATGQMFLQMLAVMSQYERKLIGERTRDALAYLKTSGVQLGSAALGWDHGNDKEVNEAGRRRIFFNDPELDTVKLIVELRDDHDMSLRAICGRLTELGKATKRGGRWQANTIRKILIRARAGQLEASAA